MSGNGLHPPGRRRLRSAVRPDGYEVWTIDIERYDSLRELIIRTVSELDMGDGVYLRDLVIIAGGELAGHPKFTSGRFTNWVRFVKVDLEVEGVIERVGTASPQRLRIVE